MWATCISCLCKPIQALPCTYHGISLKHHLPFYYLPDVSPSFTSLVCALLLYHFSVCNGCLVICKLPCSRPSIGLAIPGVETCNKAYNTSPFRGVGSTFIVVWPNLNNLWAWEFVNCLQQKSACSSPEWPLWKHIGQFTHAQCGHVHCSALVIGIPLLK